MTYTYSALTTRAGVVTLFQYRVLCYKVKKVLEKIMKYK